MKERRFFIRRLYRAVRAWLAGPIHREAVAFASNGAIFMNPIHREWLEKVRDMLNESASMHKADYREPVLVFDPLVPATRYVSRKERALRVWKEEP